VRRRNLATVVFLDGHAEGAETRGMEVAQALAMQPLFNVYEILLPAVWILDVATHIHRRPSQASSI
jgi:prepilin-type processing-associated H-X9-DG protein